MMDMNKSILKIKNKSNFQREEPLSILETCCSGMIMGFIAYSGSFATVPIMFTLTALTFGSKSLITLYMTAFALLAAGYLHTHSSRTGMSVSTKIFHGFYIAKPEMRNRRHYNETRFEALKRYFISTPINAFVLNFMWETFTIFYFLQTEIMMNFIENNSTSKEIENKSLTKELGPYLILLHGITRYFAGCLSAMSTAIINHLWQRYQTHSEIPHAIFNTNKKKLKLESKERKKLLSPFNMENWIKVFVMVPGALFLLASTIPNITGLHLLDLHTKKLIGDVLVINGGWFFLRDGAMLIFKKREKPPQTPLNSIETPLIVEEVKTMNDNQSETFKNTAEV